MTLSQESAATTKRPHRSRGSFLSYHARRCSICRHPEREIIDQEFLHWAHVGSIAETYQVERRAIYRHAHATGLFRRRNRGLRFALGHIIEQAQTVEVTADSIVRAVRLFACLNDAGEWVAPPPSSPRTARVQESPRGPRRAGARRGGSDAGEWVAPPPRSASHLTKDRSTHPADLNIRQVIENTASRPDQIDTIPHP